MERRDASISDLERLTSIERSVRENLLSRKADLKKNQKLLKIYAKRCEELPWPQTTFTELSIINRILGTDYSERDKSDWEISELEYLGLVKVKDRGLRSGRKHLSSEENKRVDEVRERIATALRNRAERAKAILKSTPDLEKSINHDEVMLKYISISSESISNPKSLHVGKNGTNYSFWVGNSPVIRINADGTFSTITTTSQSNPFKIDTRKAQPRFFFYAQEALGLARGDFCDTNSCRIYGKEEDFAREIFEKVENGLEIFPDDSKERGYREKTIRNELEVNARNWGQTMLSSLKPVRIVQGQLLGSGGSYKAFFYDDGKVVVEPDETNRATYLINEDYFETLRSWPRFKILKSNPNGFDGRIIHKGETDSLRKVWFNLVLDYLSRNENLK